MYVSYTCVYLHCTVSYYENTFIYTVLFLIQLWTFTHYKNTFKTASRTGVQLYHIRKTVWKNTFQGINYRTSLQYYILNLRNTHRKATKLTTCPSPVITTCRLALTFKRPPACWQIRWDESTSRRRYWYNVRAMASALPTYSWYYYSTAQLFETTTRNWTSQDKHAVIPVRLLVHAKSRRRIVLFKCFEIINEPFITYSKCLILLLHCQMPAYGMTA